MKVPGNSGQMKAPGKPERKKAPEKILILSDSHGHNDRVRAVIRKEEPFDLLIHLGDAMGLEELLPDMVSCPVVVVAGNCDFFSAMPLEITFSLGPHRVLAVHGHMEYVSYGLEMLREKAVQNGCDIVMYGHTHQPLIDWSQPGMLVLNPGSITYPRQEGRERSYMVLTMDKEGKLDAEVRYL